MPEFILEEDSLFELLRDIISRAEELSDLVELAHDVVDSEVSELLVLEDFYSIVKDGVNIADLLYSHYGNGDIRDIIARFDVVVGRANDIVGYSAGVELLRERAAGAVIAIKEMDAPEWWDVNKMIHLSKPEDMKFALRKLFLVEKHGEKELYSFCIEMFDNIYFHSPPCFKSLGLSFHENIEKLICHLSYLNDHAMEDFNGEASDSLIIGKAGSHGVEISPESVKTHQNSAAMSERNVYINGEVLCCEWHTKFTPARGRIHFYAGANRSEKVKDKVGMKVVAGIFTVHLST